MWLGSRQKHQQQKCTMEQHQSMTTSTTTTKHYHRGGNANTTGFDFQQHSIPSTSRVDPNRGLLTPDSPEAIHGLRQPFLHFPPPPSYPPPHSGNNQQHHHLQQADTNRMLEDLMSIPGPSTQDPTAWIALNDYSYAYYEPGPPTRHTNIPNKYLGSSSRRGSYREGSYRAKHTYLTRYGTEENIYEEISEVARARMNQHSIMSLNQSLVEEEVRRVQSGHRRVLGELNLSVEAMLMPSSREGSDDTDRDTEVEDQLADLLTVGPTDELLSPVPNVDLDSGFSGSSSGASYRSAAGSLRRGPEKCNKSLLSGGNATCLKSAIATNPDSSAQQTKSFWSRKGWKKLGLSNISLNKSSNKGKDAVEICNQM
ncbi:rho guanine nucleotide exchange factor [Holotrichia oblita]|uniref:Rho guanine nucleotide exchange factor n=3 Tax=Holotrichia oblita TaxID=644536 RepID=A0ACB9T0T5_HOLOL|nr:rho guanine nucleotide exchange factor [Holotrichia oblita]KAI4460400.1 rho guanine nucleotide exchange factor [Holotrichia oblita]KAI4460415.1 rho guanine nucleotide exchange factor [Holotrichia oblita]